MRALVLSDIHANIDALDAVMASAPPHDAVWNLGDIAGYGATPNAVVDQVRAMHGVVVRGNHDRVCSGLESGGNFNPIALAAARWTQTQLTPENQLWLRELAKGPVSPKEGRALCVHGSLRHEDEYLLSTQEAAQQLPALENSSPARLVFFGHTHIQGGFFAEGNQPWKTLRPQYHDHDTAEAFAVDLREGENYLINPGSIGQPRDHDWRAAFALYDADAPRVVFHRVPYDVRLAQMRIQRAGLPEKLGSRLRVGR